MQATRLIVTNIIRVGWIMASSAPVTSSAPALWLTMFTLAYITNVKVFPPLDTVYFYSLFLNCLTDKWPNVTDVQKRRLSINIVLKTIDLKCYALLLLQHLIYITWHHVIYRQISVKSMLRKALVIRVSLMWAVWLDI